MTRRNDEDPLERLRAADPAAGGGAPDQHRIRAGVDRRLAATGEAQRAASDDAGAEPVAPAHTSPETGTDQLAARRRRRQPLRYAAAAVGAVLLLGGGYALGSGSGTLTAGTAADSAAGSESQAEDAGSDQSAPQAPELGSTPQAEPGDADGSSGGSEQLSPGSPRTVFTAGDLPAGPEQAQVYALEPGTSRAGEQAARFATALGLSGEPHEEDGTWVVGGDDDGAPVLRLHPDGALSYADPALQPWTCLPVDPLPEPHTSGPATQDGQSAAAECADADVPAPPDAAQTFAAFLTGAGLDAGRYEIHAVDSGVGAHVTATLLLGGQVSDVRITGTVVPDGIAAVWGTVAAPTELGEYPLISPTQAVQRLTDPRFFGGSDVVAFPDPRFADNSDSAASSSGVVAVPDPRFSGPAPTPGSLVPWPVRQVQITTAELTLVSTLTSTGVLVLPSYQLTGTDADGTEGTWTVPALTEDAFDFDG